MKLVVDGLIFQKDPHGGIARLYQEVLPRLCELEPDLHITLFLDGPVKSKLPAHPRIQVQRAPAVKRTLRVSGLARQLLFPFRRVASRGWNRLRQLWLGRGEGAIWHSTYYTLPASWDGPQVVTLHDMIHERFPELFNDPLDDVARRQKRRCVEAAQAVMCVSQATLAEAARYYPDQAHKMVVVPNGYSKTFTPAKLCEPTDPAAADSEPVGIAAYTPNLLYVGGRAHYKNFAGFLEVYAAHAEWEDLWVVGAPWSEAERQQLRQPGLEGRVHLLTHIDDTALRTLYNQAGAFIYPSRYEGFGIPLLEAMACGCPVVASDIPSSREVAGDIPFYFDPDQPASLAAAVDQAVKHGRASERLQAGLERVQLFSWEHTAAEMLAVYRKVLAAYERQ